MILHATTTQMLFSGIDNQGQKPNLPWQSNYFLPSTYPFRSSHQIENNALPISHSISNQSLHNMSKLSQHQYPYSCIGLVLSEHRQNNNTYYVYGPGIIIHNNIVLTSAKNVYCRRLDKEYVNIKFITGVNGNKYSRIYDVMRVHYPKEYLKWNYQNYDFTILQLYEDLSKLYGYVVWKTNYKIQNKKNIVLGYIGNITQKSFYLRQLTKYGGQNLQICFGSSVLNKEGNQYYLVGLQYLSNGIYKILNQVMRRMINEWTKYSRIQMQNKNMGQKCRQILKYTTSDLREMILTRNNIQAQGCQYLSQANWKHLTQINLYKQNWCIRMQVSQSSQLDTLDQSRFMEKQHLRIRMRVSESSQWIHLTNLDLFSNKIRVQGFKYLSQANWKQLTMINLGENYICAQGCKYLNQANWKHLTMINLVNNDIEAQGCKYLSQANWIYLTNIGLGQNNINDIIYRLLLKQSYPNVTISI